MDFSLKPKEITAFYILIRPFFLGITLKIIFRFIFWVFQKKELV